MFKRFFVIFSIFGLILSPLFVSAQSEDILLEEEVEEVVTESIITSEDFVQVEKKIIFDAAQSVIPEESRFTPTYRWDFGDGFFEIGEEVVHQYTAIGTYDVTLTMTYDSEEFKVSKSVFVYDRRALLIIDAKKQEEINLIDDQARKNGVALRILSPEGPDADFFSEDSLVKSIGEQTEYIKDSQVLMFYTKSLRGLQAFTRYWQGLSIEDKELVRKKFFGVITDGSVSVTSHGVFQNFQIIEPNYILLTRSEALNPILAAKDIKEIESSLFGRGIEFKRIDEKSGKSKLYVLSTLITSFIERGVSADSIYLILVVPFLAFIVIFFRHVIGISTFGIYTPVIITVAFYILGLGFGILTFLFAVITGYIVKYIFEKFEFLYLPKVALNLSFITLSFLLLMLLMLWLGTPFSLSVAVFPMLVMSTLSEKFMAAKSEEGLRNAVVGVIETLAVVVISYYLMVWAAFNDLVISWPEVVIVPLVLMLILGKFSGLRISEYFRFRSLFSDHTEE
ncbi:PKD domain-containing protein [Candidatus Parcubacteria bacterium]|jgi:hypothetical protein|nr:PKD domain-containing protein [Candidatus Parcubacteria bacterium]MBT3949177.1 PKD domain-containing protein [Candidatus Parcubacteria bacterium]